jgi:hypothetical protein
VAAEYEPVGMSSTVGFVPYCAKDGSWWVMPAMGTGSAGSGTVWENLTCGLPISNPNHTGYQHCVVFSMF